MNNYEREHVEMLRPLLPECTVLLKKNGAFPLDGPCRIAAYGSGVRFTVKGGTGSGEVNSRYFVNIEDGLKNAGFDVADGDWAEKYSEYAAEARKQFNNSIKQKAKKEKKNIIAASMGAVMTAPEYDIPMDLTCDAAVYVVSRISGEGNDRLPEKGDFKLTDSEVRDILALNKAYDKFMLVINAGGPVDLSPVTEAGNILVLSQLGVETGDALADILLGKAYPSGKLTTTWTLFEEYSTAGDFGERDDTCYREGIYVGYRYFDAVGTEPLFPFGYGLGYTEFSAETEKTSQDNGHFEVTVKVSNTGSFKGKEVPQVYVSCPAGKLDREFKSLAGFAKTPEIDPGESASVKIDFDIRDLAAYDASSASYILEKGDYILLTGTSSADAVPCAIYKLAEDYVVRKSENLFGTTGFDDLKNFNTSEYIVDGVPVYEMTLTGGPEMPRKIDVKADADASGHTVLFNLKAEDLAYLNIGAFKSEGSMSGVVGDSAISVAGAAGESTGKFSDAGIRNIIMSDGPAGIRISSRYYEDKKGKHSVDLPIPESMLDMLPPVLKFIMKAGSLKARGKEIKEQYCTALPIATAIAQSFNVELAETCGDIVGKEMDIFGVDLWLAPAMNIHRSVLCGRNFEYFSEDPLLSGKMAAALTRGVQKHPGRGVTIKHFAANNQETNRYANNSVISERAIREIYLKGFGICIRESDPMAVMTSYNLLNGKHTSESRELTTDILFGEFGFDGLVMTDWVIGGGLLLAAGSKYGVPDTALVAAAGCSLFMPGRKNDYKELCKGLKAGKVTTEQLRWNAGRIIRVLERLGKN